MSAQEIKDGISKGEWLSVDGYNLRIEDSDYNCIAHFDDADTDVKETEANAAAITQAVNNTWNKGYDPEKVEEMYKALQMVQWDMHNGESEAQRQGKPRYSERLEIITQLLSSAKLK